MLEKGVTGGGEALSKAITAVINVRNVYEGFDTGHEVKKHW